MTDLRRRVNHRGAAPLCTLVIAIGAVLSVLTAAAPAVAQRSALGDAPSTRSVRHFVSRGFHHLHWSRVAGATSYQIFVKVARFDEHLPAQWHRLKSVDRTRTTIFVPLGQTRQFGVRAVGAPSGSRYEVTGISDFGTISRPPDVRTLTGVRHWHVVHGRRLYRGMALEARRAGAALRLRAVKDTGAIRVIGESGRQYGAVNVYIGRRLLRSVDFGAVRHNARRQFRIRPHQVQSGPIRLVTTSSRPVRISVVGQVRWHTVAPSQPAAPMAYPAASSFTFTGAGWGHGVGLSQYGAQAMAKHGFSTKEILQHYYRGVSVSPSGTNRLIDVNVGYHRTRTIVRLRSLTAGARLQVCASTSGASCTRSAVVTDATADGTPAGRVTLVPHAGSVTARVRDEHGHVTVLTAPEIRLRWTGTRLMHGPAAVLRLGDGDEFRHGEMLVHPYGSGRINVVLRQRLEEYLRGVGEMPSSWEPAALQAQAIIARTYALKDGASLRTSCACDLRNTVVDQNYTGWAKENEGNGRYGRRWVTAVTSTAGKVVTYHGELASTYYFSSSGGRTLNSQDVWSSAVPYLQSVGDRWSLTADNPNRAWTASVPQARVSRIFGFPVHALRVSQTYEGGAMRSVTAIDPQGAPHTITEKSGVLRGDFGLKSAWVSSIQASYR